MTDIAPSAWLPDAVAICVPVRDEAALLPRFLAAVAGLQRTQPVTLCVLLDGCSDESGRIVNAAAATLEMPLVVREVPAGGEPDAGRARAGALALGQQATAADRRAALLTTDADSVPAPDWIAANVAALAVADVVAGRIVRDSAHRDPAQDRLEHYYDRLFALRRALDPVPWEAAVTHHYTGGASLGFRDEAYAALGGFQPRRSGEDAAIVDEAHRAGLRVRRDAAIRVETSSRRVGRAIGGLADHLRTLDRQAAAIRVSHPADAAWQYAGHAAARHAFARLPEDQVAMALEQATGVPAAELRRAAAASPNAEAFALRIVPGSPVGERLLGLAAAERALEGLLPGQREVAA